MFMKSHQFAVACLTLLLLTMACSATKAVDETTARTLDCSSADEYTFPIVPNPSRKKNSDPTVPQDLHIVVGNKLVSRIELPKESEAKNFSLNGIRKTEAGFEVNVDWGGGLNHYEIRFNFKCKENKFYLYEVRKETLSTTDPDSGNFLDKKESKVTKPNLPIENFVMTDWL